jgi:hypothetical protein
MPKDLGDELLILLAGHFKLDHPLQQYAQGIGPRVPTTSSILDPICLAALILATRPPICKPVACARCAETRWIASTSALRFAVMLQQIID